MTKAQLEYRKATKALSKAYFGNDSVAFEKAKKALCRANKKLRLYKMPV